MRTTQLIIEKLAAVYAEKGIEALLPQNLSADILNELIDACNDVRIICREQKVADGHNKKEVHSYATIHWLTKAFSDYKYGTQGISDVPWNEAWDRKINKLITLYSTEPLRRSKVIDVTSLPQIDTIFDYTGGIKVLNEEAFNDWVAKQ